MVDHDTKIKARIYVPQGLNNQLGESQTHYLRNVLRCEAGDSVLVFNEIEGEFLAKLTSLSKKTTIITRLKQTRTPFKSPDIWLLFAPLKKTATDFVIQKATELGVSKILPVTTDLTNSERINLDRMTAQAMEAAEQCERFDIPEILDLQKLDDVLHTWPQSRPLIYCAERDQSAPALTTHSTPLAVLIGPEGGFSEREHDLILSLPFVKPVSLGKRILKAETAAIVALARVQ